jgi:hypothetical protein
LFLFSGKKKEETNNRISIGSDSRIAAKIDLDPFPTILYFQTRETVLMMTFADDRTSDESSILPTEGLRPRPVAFAFVLVSRRRDLKYET